MAKWTKTERDDGVTVFEWEDGTTEYWGADDRATCTVFSSGTLHVGGPKRKRRLRHVWLWAWSLSHALAVGTRPMGYARPDWPVWKRLWALAKAHWEYPH